MSIALALLVAGLVLLILTGAALAGIAGVMVILTAVSLGGIATFMYVEWDDARSATPESADRQEQP